MDKICTICSHYQTKTICNSCLKILEKISKISNSKIVRMIIELEIENKFLKDRVEYLEDTRDNDDGSWASGGV